MDTAGARLADLVPPTENEKLDANHVIPYNPQLVLMSGAIGLLLLFIRIGPFSFILVIIVSFTLSALPDFRSIVDSTLGTSLSPQRRLAEAFPDLAVVQSKSSHRADLDSSSNFHHQPNQNLIKLDQLPDQLQSAFGSLFDLILRDYVESWYLLPSVSTGNSAFLHQLRNALNHILLKAHAKLTTKSSKETMIYLIGCLSMNLVRELNDRAHPKCQTSYQDRIVQRLTQTRRISEEILLTLGSSSITSSPITLNLVSEVLTVQLISITSSFNQDWFNKTLIDSLGTGTPTQISLASPSTKPGITTVTPVAVDQIKEHAKQNDSHATASRSPSSARSHSTHDAPSNISAASDEIHSVTGNDVLLAYLKSPTNFNLSISTQPNSNIRLQDLFEHTSKWAPNPVITDLERSSLLLSSSDDSVQVECLVKLFHHFDSFQKTCQSANLKPDIIKVDAISILSALAPLINYTVDQLIATQTDQKSKENLSSTWKSVIIETLRRFERVSASGSPIFGNLQEWLLDRLRLIKSQESNRVSVTSTLDTSPDIHYQPWATPAVETTRKDKIHYMALPNIPAAGSSGYTVDESPTLQSQDLASSTDQRTWDKPKSSTTEAVLRKHRTPSFSKTPVSPSSSGYGASPRREGTYESFGSSPIAALQSSTFSHSSFSPHVPEEGDMTEGYSLDETMENEGTEHNPSISLAPSLSTSTSSNRFDDTVIASTPSSQSNSSSAPPVAHNPQPASFSVSVTDMSLPSATDSKTGLIKHKKDISFLIAVEAPFVPGFIVTRGWPELERMDLAINKKKLVGVGTKDFPRALLPTNLNFKTIDHVRRELEAYLKCLLNDERYSKSEPVLKFFAKERSGMSGGGGAINNIFNSTSSTLDSIGKGVASVGKEVVSKPVDFATSGLNRLSKGVFSGLPFGHSPTSTREEHEESGSNDTGNRRESWQLSNSNNSNSMVLEPLQMTESLASTTSLNDAHQNGHPVDHSKTESKERKTEDQSALAKSNPESSTGPRPPSTDLSVTQTQDEQNPTCNSLGREVESNVHPQPSASISGTTKKIQEPMATSHVTETVKPTTPTAGKNAKPISSHNETNSSLPTSSTTAATTLSNKEFDTVIIGIISILEAAYGLDQKQGGSGHNTPWSMKRGVLRVLETILRTTSFSAFIRLTLSQIIDKFEKVETYVDLINSALLSLSSSTRSDKDDGSLDTDEHPSFKNKRKNRRQKSLSSLISDDDSFDELSLDMSSAPSSHSSPAATKSQQYQYKSLDDEEDPKKKKTDIQSKADRAAELKSERQLAARKLFIDSWSSLKIGLGSNATDVAASKVFDLFQEFPLTSEVSQTQDHHQSKSDNLDPHAHIPSGIEFIVHNLLLDLIRIILLL